MNQCNNNRCNPGAVLIKPFKDTICDFRFFLRVLIAEHHFAKFLEIGVIAHSSILQPHRPPRKLHSRFKESGTIRSADHTDANSAVVDELRQSPYQTFSILAVGNILDFIYHQHTDMIQCNLTDRADQHIRCSPCS